METSQEFREFAKECDRLAEEVETENQRRILKEMAVAWRKVAEEDERNNSSPTLTSSSCDRAAFSILCQV